ncbi:hypothetical protein FKP32DRAFT_8904 [Trametes sanguinea]|nr:hypothetical protein FKP32DRAFT_8904 [Trametes sanguinea]
MYVLRDSPRPRMRQFGGPFRGGGGGFCGGFAPPWLTGACEGDESSTSTKAQETSSTDSPDPTPTSTTDPSKVDTSASVASTTDIVSDSDTASTPANTLTSTSPPDQGTTTTDVSTTLVPVTESGTTVLVPTTIATPSTTSVPGLVPGSRGRGMTAGEIAAICIACVSVLALSLIVLRVWRKRSAGRQLNGAQDRGSRDTTSDRIRRSDATQSSATPRDTVTSSASSLSTFVQPAGPSNVMEDEKTGIATEVPQAAAPIDSPSTSMAASSPSSELSPTLTQPSAFLPRRPGGAWDDPPPTPELHQLVLETNQHAYQSPSFPLSLYSPIEPTVASPVYEPAGGHLRPMHLEEEVAEADLGELPEYSRE